MIYQRKQLIGQCRQRSEVCKAKEPIEVAPTIEKPMIERKKNVADQRMLNKPRNQFVGRSESWAKSRPRP